MKIKSDDTKTGLYSFLSCSFYFLSVVGCILYQGFMSDAFTKRNAPVEEMVSAGLEAPSHAKCEGTVHTSSGSAHASSCSDQETVTSVKKL